MPPEKATAELAERESKRLYIMYYRHGMNPQLSKGFYLNGTMEEAMLRARRHCTVMGYRYIFTRPWICDLDAEEAYKLKTGKEDSVLV